MMQADEETKFIRQASAIATGNDPSIQPILHKKWLYFLILRLI